MLCTVAPARTGLQESSRLPKRKSAEMTICTHNTRMLASVAPAKHLIMQLIKIKYRFVSLTETRRRHPLSAVYKTGGELFLRTCDSRGFGVDDELFDLIGGRVLRPNAAIHIFAGLCRP
ncbi:hypothetical protein RB195_021050 [Necator americanus]|uniref:Uncharacterized protein n=1 Tax=Necator americanus TaxID=51031 RepID=A0ABR1E9A3_NECAM